MSRLRTRARGWLIIRREDNWRKFDSRVWFALTVELRFQEVEVPILADHLDTRTGPVFASLDRLMKAGLVTRRWSDDDVLNGNRRCFYRAEPLKRSTEALDAKPGVTVFYSAYSKGREDIVTSD